MLIQCHVCSLNHSAEFSSSLYCFFNAESSNEYIGEDGDEKIENVAHVNPINGTKVQMNVGVSELGDFEKDPSDVDVLIEYRRIIASVEAADCIIFLFKVTDQGDICFDNLKNWITFIKNEIPDACIILANLKVLYVNIMPHHHLLL